MQMTKKVVSVVLAVMMVVSMMTVMGVATASAATYDGVADGYYVLSDDNSWTPGTPLAKNNAYTGDGLEYMGVIDTTANADYKIAYIENGEANFWAPGGANAKFDADYTGKSIIYFKTVDNSWVFKKGTVGNADEFNLAVAAGGSWKLLGDVQTAGTTTISKDLSLDLNGKKITSTGSDTLTVTSGVTLNLTNTDTNNTGYVYTEKQDDVCYGVFNVGGTVNVAAGVQVGYDIDKTGGIYNKGGVANINGGTVYGKGSSYAAVVVAKPGAAVNVNSGNVTGSGTYAITGNGSADQSGYAIKVSGGTVSSDKVAIYHPNTGSLTIEGGTVSGTAAVYTKAGTTSITGGTLTATAEKAAFVHNGNGCNATGDALVVEACDYPGTIPEVTISGGTFNTAANGGSDLGAYTYRATDAVTVALDNVTLASAYGDDNATFKFENGASITNLAVDDDCKVVTDATTGAKTVVPKDYVAQIGTTKYESLDSAIGAAADGDTITVLADTTITNATVPANKAVTLDCADKTVTVTPWNFANNGTLTVTGTTGGLTGEKGLVDNYGTLNIAGGVYSTTATNPAFWNNLDGNVINVTGGTIDAAGTAIVNDKGTTNISGGIIKGSVVVQDADATFTMSGTAAIELNKAANAVEITAGTANLNGGTITCTGDANGVFIVGDDSVLNVNGTEISTVNNYCISSNGSANKGYEGFEITINSGTFTSTNDAVVFMPQAGTLEINGGTFTGVEALYIKSGTVTINGGTFVSTADHTDFEHSGNGTKDTGDVIFVESCNYPGGVPVVTINGGSFDAQGTGTYALAAYTFNDQDVEVALGDGVVIADAYGAEDATFTFGEGASITNLAVDDDCKVVVDETTGDKTVVPKDYVAQIGTTKYETLQAAIAAAQSGDTIELLSDIDVTERIVINKDVTITGGGHTLKTTAAAADCMFIYGSKDHKLTISNTVLDGNNLSENAIWTQASGGGSTQSAEVTLTDVTVKNFKGYTYVGAVYLFSNAVGNFNNCVFQNNATPSDSDDGLSGKDIWAGAKATVNINNGSVGDVYLHGGSASVTVDGNATVGTVKYGYTTAGEDSTQMKATVVSGTVENVALGTGIQLAAENFVAASTADLTNAPAGYKWVDSAETGKKTLAPFTLQDAADTALTYGIEGLTFVDGTTTTDQTAGYKASLLGVQLRQPLTGDVAYEDGTNGENTVRYIAAVDKEFLNSLSADADYGFEVTVGNRKTELSCKGTQNTVINGGKDDKLEYFTFAIKDITQTDTVITVKFYVKDGNETAYAKYTKVNPQNEHAIIASYNGIVAHNN